MNVGQQLQQMRKKLGLTQESVAERMNITRQTLSNWERGINLPDIYTIAGLAAIYNVSLDEFFLGKSFFKGGQSMKTNYSDAQIERLIKKHDPDARAIQILSGGLVSQTFSFQSGEKKLIFQCGGKKEAYEKELFVSRRYIEQLPVRRMQGIYENTDGRAYCFSDYIEGCKVFDLTHEAIVDLVPEILEFLAVMEAVKAPGHSGFGRFDHTGRARYDSWPDFVSSICKEELFHWESLDDRMFDRKTIQDAIAFVEKNVDGVEIEQSSLVHGDLGSYNLLTDGAQITGAIDWSMALYGDSLYDVANILFWNEDKLQALVAAINSRYLSDAVCMRRINCYRIRIGLEEIYNMAVLNEIGYDVSWVMNRLKAIVAELL